MINFSLKTRLIIISTVLVCGALAIMKLRQKKPSDYLPTKVCNNKLFEQIDGVSMWSALGPVLTNIILTEFEKRFVSDLIKSGTIKFYRRYVDDTLMLITLSKFLLCLTNLIVLARISSLLLKPFLTM